MTSVSPFLLFTDLDGTLLNHSDYSWSEAEEALSLVKKHQIPLIVNTSKTLAESIAIQRRLGFGGPMIFENGAGVALPVSQWQGLEKELARDGDYWIKSFAMPYVEVRRVLERLREQGRFKFRGFGDMDVNEIHQLTGLDVTSAGEARQRYFCEPVVWQDTRDHLTEFFAAIEASALTHASGGRFIHIMGAADKGKAMRWLTRLYSQACPMAALGDSENDLPMLQEADIAVLVRSPAHELPTFPRGQQPRKLQITERYGPAGWNQAVLRIIEEFTRG